MVDENKMRILNLEERLKMLETKYYKEKLEEIESRLKVLEEKYYD